MRELFLPYVAKSESSFKSLRFKTKTCDDRELVSAVNINSFICSSPNEYPHIKRTESSCLRKYESLSI